MAIVKWEIPSRRGGFGKKMNIHEFSVVYVEKGSCAITLNQFLNEVIEKKALSHLMIEQEDTTGEVYLVLNNNEGVPLSRSGGNKSKNKGESSYNYRICSKQWVVHLLKELSLPLVESRTILNITDNLSRRDDCVTFRIIPKK